MNGFVAVVGATGAVGSALCRRVAASGGSLLMLARDTAGAESLKNTLQNSSSHKIIEIGDVAADPTCVSTALASSDLGDIKGLAYALGSITLKPLTKCSPQDFITSYNLNLIGAVESAKATAGAIAKNGGGSMVFFSTVAVQQGFPSHTVVSSSKGAVEGMTRSLAAELASKNIRVNAIAPSLLQSKMAGPMAAGKMGESIANAHPLKRLGSGDDAAAAALYLLSSDSTWVTGQVLGVDGGRHAVA